MAAQTTDPTNPGHKVAFTYDAEGAQLTRVDSRQTAGPASGACGEAGVSCETLRTTTNAYNNDTTLRSSVSTDQAGQSLATCHDDGSGPASGYDADKHPLAVRTLSATTTCSGGRTEREVTMSYDSRGLLSTMTQKVRGDSGLVARSQSFEHRLDTTVSSATHAGRTTTYGRSPAGWSESISAEREPGSPKASTFSYSPAGAPTGSSLGSGTATSTRAHTPDGMVASLVWSAAGTTVRSHTNLAYDVGGLRTAEAVAVVHPATATGTDPGGPAAYAYDLARRLVSYTSPYKAEPTDTAEPTVAYGLDDGSNIVRQLTRVGAQTREDQSSDFEAGRLSSRISTTSTGKSLTTYSYSPLGEEIRSQTSQPTIAGSETVLTSYDPAGHVALVDKVPTYDNPNPADVSYIYDGFDHLLSRTEAGATTLYFYWGPGSTLAEETDGSGATLARYVVDGAEPVAQHTFRRILGGGKDPTDTAGTWAWLLDDPAGNVATTVGDNGAVLSQAAFDPYGVPEATGKSKALGPDAKTSLGFQSALTDPTTEKVILGPRQYDPKTARFTNPDVFVGGSADLALGTDPLTGNRYLFAGANPVANYEDGHCFAGKGTNVRRVVDQRRLSRLVKVADASPAGYHWNIEYYNEDVYRSEKICVRAGVVGELVDYSLANDITRSVADPLYSNRFRSAEQAIAERPERLLLAAAAPCARGSAEGLAIGLIAGPPGVATAAGIGCAQGVGLSALKKLGMPGTEVLNYVLTGRGVGKALMHRFRISFPVLRRR